MIRPRGGRVTGAALLCAISVACASSTVRPAGPQFDFLVPPGAGERTPAPPAASRAWQLLLEGPSHRARRAIDALPPGAPVRLALTAQLCVLRRDLDGARRACDAARAAGAPSAALLAACAQASEDSGNFESAYFGFLSAAHRAPAEEGLRRCLARCADEAVADLLSRARRASRSGRPAEAAVLARRAAAVSPGNRSVALELADAERQSGDIEGALGTLSRLVAEAPSDEEAMRRLGDLALHSGRYRLALDTYRRLAALDPRYRREAGEAEEEFVISNWPTAEREAAHAQRLTRAQGCLLAMRVVPELREAGRPGSPAVASDLIGVPGESALQACAVLGLLRVDPATHLARPEAPLSRPDAAWMLSRAVRALAPRESAAGRCLIETRAPAPVDALTAAGACGLMAAGGDGIAGSELWEALTMLRGNVRSTEP